MKSNLLFQFKLDFSPDLLQKISLFIEENQIYALWYGPIWGSQHVNSLWILTPNKAQIEAVFSIEYTKKLTQMHQVFVQILDEKDIAYHEKIGNTVFKTSLTQDHLIFQKEDHRLRSPLFKPLSGFKAQYMDKQSLLIGYCQDFVASKINGSTLAYLKTLSYNFEILEWLLLGVKNTRDSFGDRLLILETILPQMKTLFVKSKAQSYYLLDHLDEDDLWCPALEKIQQNLQGIVLDVIDLIDRKTAFYKTKQTSKKKITYSFKYKEKLLPLLETNQIEEIYQFHETLYFKADKQIRQCYLLVVTKKKNHKEFQEIIAKIATEDPEVHFTILTHTRLYIQEQAELVPTFFKGIMKPKNRIYASDYYPQIHWQKKYWSSEEEYPMLWKKTAEKTNKIIQTDLQHPSNETFISTYQLHKCLAFKLQIYILHHLHYLPLTAHLDTLIHLALFAQNKEAPTLNTLYTQLDPLLFVYTCQKKEEKKYNLVLDPPTVHCLQQFLSTIEVLKT